ncbi:hypothetical protein [Nonomuraea sp. CA-141351]|uniref:hypothetical protein n=1 Tax=Nonomuraea sp. CA-141351 TaxID=3239996 RepID=UPI003D91EBD5
MKGKLLAAGGVLITGAALFGLAGPAGAEAGPCELSEADVSHPLWAGDFGVDAEACADLTSTSRPITYDAIPYDEERNDDWYRTGRGREPYVAIDTAPAQIHLYRWPWQRSWVSRWGSPAWSAGSAWDDGG